VSDRSVPPKDERQPILRIKKSAERDVPAHYDRAERLSLHAAPEERPPSRAGRRFPKWGRFHLFPILILALGIAVIYRFLPARDSSTAAIGGMTVSLRSYAYQDGVLAVLTFSGRLPAAPAAASAVCSFANKGLPSVLSGEIGEANRILSGRMEGGSAGATLTAHVTVAGVQRTLTGKVQRAPE
jgi:hypothetical protein